MEHWQKKMNEVAKNTYPDGFIESMGNDILVRWFKNNNESLSGKPALEKFKRFTPDGYVYEKDFLGQRIERKYTIAVDEITIS